MAIEDVLSVLGYRPKNDSWDTDGRLTYIHDDDTSRAWMTSITRILGRQGWTRDKNLFRHDSGLLIEIESGGDASGHYLHLMKAELAAS